MFEHFLKKQAEAEVLPSSSLVEVEVEVGVGVEIEVKVELRVEGQLKPSYVK